MRGVLSRLAPAVTEAPAPRAAAPAVLPPQDLPPAQVAAPVASPVAAPVASPVAAPVAVRPVALWPLLALGWLVLCAMILALIWRMIAPCGLRPWPQGLCSRPAGLADPALDRAGLLRDLAALEHRLSASQQGCALGVPPPAPLQKTEITSGLRALPHALTAPTLAPTLAPPPGPHLGRHSDGRCPRPAAWALPGPPPPQGGPGDPAPSGPLPHRLALWQDGGAAEPLALRRAAGAALRTRALKIFAR